jgi:hypothetical protein
MSKKYLAVIAPLLAIAAFAVVPAMAQAGPEWHVCVKGSGAKEFTNHECNVEKGGGGWIWVKVGNKANAVSVLTHGILTLHALGVEIECEVDDEGFIWNENMEGRDEVTKFENLNCKTTHGTCATPEIIALRLGVALSATNAWPTKLLAGPPIRDEIKEIEIDVKCGGTLVDTFTGTLRPEMLNGSPLAAFFGTGSGELEDAAVPTKNKATVSGEDLIEQLNGWAVKVE